MPGRDCANFYERVPREIGSRLLDALWIVGDDLEAGENLRYLLELVGVVGRDEYLH